MEGINNLLYGKKTDKEEKLLTQNDLMEIFDIKDVRTLKKRLNDEMFPYFTMGGKIYTEPSQYKKWLQLNYVNRL